MFPRPDSSCILIELPILVAVGRCRLVLPALLRPANTYRSDLAEWGAPPLSLARPSPLRILRGEGEGGADGETGRAVRTVGVYGGRTGGVVRCWTGGVVGYRTGGGTLLSARDVVVHAAAWVFLCVLTLEVCLPTNAAAALVLHAA